MSADGIESANVVGYSTTQMISGKYNMIAVPFNPVNGTGFMFDGDVLFENVVEGEDFADGDNILIWNAETSGYTFHYYYVGEGWTDDSGNGYFADDYPNGLPAGSAMWYLAANNDKQVKITFAGAVESDADVTYTLIKGKYNMIANPYPVSFDPNEASQVEWSGVVEGEDFADTDNILVWNPQTSGYTFHYYYAGEGWTDDSGNGYFADDYPNGLPAGSAMWYLATPGDGQLSVKFKKSF